MGAGGMMDKGGRGFTGGMGSQKPWQKDQGINGGFAPQK